MSTASAALLAYFQVSPWAVEPARDVMAAYENSMVGYLAGAIVLALIGSVGLRSLYGTVLWYRVKA